MKKNMSYLVLGLFAALTIGAMSNPVTWVEKMFLPSNNFVNPGFEANDTGLCLGNASGAAPTTDQVCSTTPDLSKAYETTNPIDGLRSIKISKAAGSSRQGEFIALDFTINRYQRNSPNTLSFRYEASSNFVYGDSGDIKVYIADKTTSQIITPAFNTLDGSGYFQAGWTPSSNRNYQLLLWIPTTTTLSWDLVVDQFSNKLTEGQFIPFVSDLEPVTVTGSWTTNTTYSALMAIQGQFAYFDVLVSLSGTPNSAGLTINLPYKIDVSEIQTPPSANNFVVLDGTGIIKDAGGNSYLANLAVSSASDTNVVSLRYGVLSGSLQTGGINQATPFAFGSGDSINVKFKVPIQGWTSGAKTQGQILQNVPVVFDAFKSGGAVSSNTTIPSWTTRKDTVGAFNAITGVYTVKIPGDYQVNVTYYFTTSVANLIYIRKNGTVVQYMSAQTGDVKSGSALLRDLVPGDQITLTTNGNLTIGTDATGAGTTWSMFKIESPSALLNIPKVATIKDVKAANTAGGTFTSGSYQTRTLNNLDDPFGIVALSSNQFTLQPGTYRINASAPAYQVNAHKLKLRNITAGSDTLIGQVAYASSAVVAPSSAFLTGTFSIAVATTFEIQHRGAATRSTDGFGIQANLGDSEVYTQVEIQKLL